MSLLVAIETSTERGSVAIGSGNPGAADGLLGEVTLGVASRHAEALLPALDFLLRTARLERCAITGIVVGAGPGSFTGVRIAAATARGLAHGLDVPLYAYPSLAALALEADGGTVCALLDARRGEVYAACYARDADGGLRTVSEPVALTVSALMRTLPSPVPAFVGPGAARYTTELGIASPAAVTYPRAAALLRLAATDVGRGAAGEDSTWEPTYVRASGAERGLAG